MTYFETLNPTIEALHALFLVMVMSPKMKATSLGLEHLLKSLFEHLSLERYICLGGYPYLLLDVKILLLDAATMKGSF